MEAWQTRPDSDKTTGNSTKPDRYSAAHDGLVAGSSPGEPLTISMADHLHTGEGLRPRLQKFVAAVAP